MLDVLLMTVAVAIIILSLLQGGKSDGISGAFTGGEGLNLITISHKKRMFKIYVYKD